MRQYILGYSGISWTICKQSAPCSRQIATPTPNHSIFTGWMTPNQHCQSTVLPGTTEAKKYCTWCFWRFLRSCSIFCCFSNFSVILASRSDWCFGRLYALQLSAVCNVVSRRMHATTSLRSWTQQIRIHHNSKKQDTIYKKMNLKKSVCLLLCSASMASFQKNWNTIGMRHPYTLWMVKTGFCRGTMQQNQLQLWVP